jgi:hypothetical protein
MSTIDYNIPSELINLVKSNCIKSPEWEQVCDLIQPFPDQHMLLSTNAPNNTLILATKIYDLLGLNLSEFKVFNVINDIYDPERGHGIYTYNNKYFYMDMKRIRYDDYKYMIRILESIIYSQRINITAETPNNKAINNPPKIVVVINNFDLVLQQYLAKFIKYADTLAANVTFIYIGTGIITYYSQMTKLKGLCIVKRCIFNKLYDLKLDNLRPGDNICDMLYNFTDGDIIKSWLILQIFNNDLCPNKLLLPQTSMQLFEKYILPNMPILNSIYELLIVLRATISNNSYSVTPIMNKLYILHSYPDMSVCRIINIIFKIFTFIHAHNAKHQLYLSKNHIIKLNNLCNTFTTMDKVKPYVTNESILILRGFITKLLLFLAD